MKITLIVPAFGHSRSGNSQTAQRWAALLAGIGHEVTVKADWCDAPTDLMIALHARRSYAAMQRYRQQRPHAPLVLVLTGTDVYRDIHTDPDARQALDWADRLVVLQPEACYELPAGLRDKTQVIYQSVAQVPPRALSRQYFDVCVIGHLRPEKDPFRICHALQWLPASLPMRVTHLGEALNAPMADSARQWMKRDARYRWLGNLPHDRCLHQLAHSHLMVISSRMEGGATIVSEALAVGTPVIASNISGNIGLLGADYQGYFPLEDDRQLATRLEQAYADSIYYQILADQCGQRRPLTEVALERQSLARLLDAVQPGQPVNAAQAFSPALPAVPQP